MKAEKLTFEVCVMSQIDVIFLIPLVTFLSIRGTPIVTNHNGVIEMGYCFVLSLGEGA